jgi:hypothetical protein
MTCAATTNIETDIIGKYGKLLQHQTIKQMTTSPMNCWLVMVLLIFKNYFNRLKPRRKNGSANPEILADFLQSEQFHGCLKASVETESSKKIYQED